MYAALSVSSCPNEALYRQFQSATTLSHERLGVFCWCSRIKSVAIVLGEAPILYFVTGECLWSWLKLAGRGIITMRAHQGS